MIRSINLMSDDIGLISQKGQRKTLTPWTSSLEISMTVFLSVSTVRP